MHQRTIEYKVKYADDKIQVSYIVNSYLLEDDCINNVGGKFLQVDQSKFYAVSTLGLLIN